MKKRLKKWFYYSSIGLSLMLILYLLLQYNAIKEELSEVRYLFQKYKQEKTKEVSMLTSKIEQLQEENNELERKFRKEQENLILIKERYNNLTEDYDRLKNEAFNILERIQEYKEELAKSIEWFKSNAELDNIKENNVKNRLKSLLQNKCIVYRDTDCIINTGCIYLINSEYLNFRYLKDINTSASEDKLQSLRDFVKNGGGDCEDFSLFYKAELNFLLKECPSSSRVILKSWIPRRDERKFWLDKNHKWFLKGAESRFLLEYNYPYVVCGKLFDSIRNTTGGHCVIAFSKKKIETINDIEKLENASLIEPQDGRYIGKVGEITNILKKRSDFSYKSYISIVITNKDMFSFSPPREEWESFSFFLDELKKIEKQLEKRLK